MSYTKCLNGKVTKILSKKKVGFQKGIQSGKASLLLKDPSELSPKEQHKLIMLRGYITIDCGKSGRNSL
jgi:hypothetical protein